MKNICTPFLFYIKKIIKLSGGNLHSSSVAAHTIWWLELSLRFMRSYSYGCRFKKYILYGVADKFFLKFMALIIVITYYFYYVI